MRNPGTDKDHFILDEVFCLPHAAYSPVEKIVTFPVHQDGAHAVLFFVPMNKPEKEELFRREFKEQALGVPQQDTMMDVEYTASGRAFPFAIVVGSNTAGRTSYWLAFIAILDEPSFGGDFHKLRQENKDLVKHCFTKSQLKGRLLHDSTDVPFIEDAKGHIDHILWSWRGTAMWNWYRSRWDSKHPDSESREEWKMELCVELRVAPANLVEDTVYFCIGIADRRLSTKIMQSRQLVKDEGPQRRLHESEQDFDWRKISGLRTFPVRE